MAFYFNFEAISEVSNSASETEARLLGERHGCSNRPRKESPTMHWLSLSSEDLSHLSSVFISQSPSVPQLWYLHRIRSPKGHLAQSIYFTTTKKENKVELVVVYLATVTNTPDILGTGY